MVNHRPRKFGYSKYGVGRIIRGFLDLFTVYFLTGFNQRPQHLLGTLGIASFTVGLIGLIYLAGYWVVDKLMPAWEMEDLHNRPAMLYSMGALLLGAQFISMGFLAELLTSYLGRDVKTYSVKSRVGGTSTEKEVS